MSNSRILFWNLNKKDLCDLLQNVVVAADADIVILVENKLTSADTLAELQHRISPAFYSPISNTQRFQLFSRDKRHGLSEVYVGNRITIRRMNHSGDDLLLGIVHFVDKRSFDSDHQTSQSTLLAAEIHHQEDLIANQRTFLIGDFNMNPFDPGMNQAEGLNAMMTMKCVTKETRRHQNKDFRYFYNPMWSLFGDGTPGPAGTYYHPNSSQGTYGWNMPDQVLVRPSAARWFDKVEILTSAGSTSLKTELDRPNKRLASDHFPILLTLK